MTCAIETKNATVMSVRIPGSLEISLGQSRTRAFFLMGKVLAGVNESQYVKYITGRLVTKQQNARGVEVSS
jgi:hypothetical protein